MVKLKPPKKSKISDYIIPEFSFEEFPSNLTDLVDVTGKIDKLIGLDRFLRTSSELDIDQVLQVTSEISKFEELLVKASSGFDNKFKKQIDALDNYYLLNQIGQTESDKAKYIEFLKDCIKLISTYLQKQANFMTCSEYVGSLDLDIKKVESFYLGRAKIWREGIQSYQVLLNQARNRDMDVRQFVIDGGTEIHERIEADLNSGVKSSVEKFLDAYRAVYSTNSPRFIKRYEKQSGLFEASMKRVRNIDQAISLQESKDNIEPLIKASVSTAAINAEFFTSVLRDIRPKISFQNRSQAESFLSPEAPNPVPTNMPILRKTFDDLKIGLKEFRSLVDRPNIEEGLTKDEIDNDVEEEFLKLVQDPRRFRKIPTDPDQINKLRLAFAVIQKSNNVDKIFERLKNDSEIHTARELSQSIFGVDLDLRLASIKRDLSPKNRAEKLFIDEAYTKGTYLAQALENSGVGIKFFVNYYKACARVGEERSIRLIYNYYNQNLRQQN
jgi:hypothetical protein